MLGRRVICPSEPAYHIVDCRISKIGAKTWLNISGLFDPILASFVDPLWADRYEYSCLVPDNRDADKKPKHARQLAVSPKKESDKTALFSFGLTMEGSVRF